MKASFWIVKSFPLILKSNWCIKWVLTLQDGCQLPEYLQTIQSCKADRHFLPLILKSMTAGIVLTCKGGESRYKLAAVFTEAQSDPLHVNVVEPLVEETFTAQWQMLSEYSWYRAADVQYGDRLIVLCTCSYSHRNERTVVVARQMRAGESETVSIAKNPEAKSPW